MIMKFLSMIGNFILTTNYWLCLFVAMASLIFYLSGFKGAGKWTTLSILIYTFLQGIKGAI